MTMPPELATFVALTVVVRVPDRGVTAPWWTAWPPRLRKHRSSGLVRAAPMNAAYQPHGCSATSSSTANGMTGWRSAVKYQASGGTSYWASMAPPAASFHGSAWTSVTRARNWYGGGGPAPPEAAAP